MSEIRKPISTLVIKILIGEATTAEIAQLEAWAAESAENRNWLERFKDNNFVMSGLERMSSIKKHTNPADCYQQLPQYQQAKTSNSIRLWKNTGYASIAAALLILFLYFWLFKHLFREDVTKPIVVQTTPAVKQPIKDSEPAALLSAASNTIYNSNKNRSEKQCPHNCASPKTAPPEQLELPSIEVPQVPIPQYVSQGELAEITGMQLKNYHKINKEKTILSERLPDGSFSTLNAETTLDYPYAFDSFKRKVTLNGEAHFTVMQNGSLPFLIVANGIHIETAGGALNVRSYLNEQQTTVTAITGDGLLVAAGPFQIAIHAGETAIIKKGSPIDVYPTTNSKKLIAYKNLRFHFDNDDLNAAATEIARWYGLTVVGADSTNTRVTFRGQRNMKPADLIKSIATSDGQPHLIIKGTELIIH